MTSEAAHPGLDALCARLRGEPAPISVSTIDLARAHRVHLLLARRMTPEELDRAAPLAAEVRAAAALDAWRERELRRVLDDLSRAGVSALLLKGAGLAHTCYDRPFLRPRADLDLLIAPARLADADRALVEAGWQRAVEPDVTLVSAQRHYHRSGNGGLTEHLDLHWKIANAQVFADAVSFEALWPRSVPIPALGPTARTLSSPDALLVACLHRVAHHGDRVMLLWIWDVHALAVACTAEERDAFIALATRTRMRAVCSRGLELAAEHFRTPVASLMQALHEGRFEREPSADFLGGGRIVDVMTSDLRHARGWTSRWQLMREHLFPPRAYMGARYPGWPAPLLPLAYVYRIARGAPAWFRR